MRDHSARRARVALMLGLLAAGVPAAATAAPRLRCHIDQGGTSQVVDFSPVADPYAVQAIEINGRFRFKAVVIGDERQVQYVNLYTYFQTERRLILLHEVKYVAPEVRSDPAPDALTGRHFLYSPGREREFQFACALVEVAL